jgi:hypothetical protein
MPPYWSPDGRPPVGITPDEAVNNRRRSATSIGPYTGPAFWVATRRSYCRHAVLATRIGPDKRARDDALNVTLV